jgi:integrase
LLRP